MLLASWLSSLASRSLTRLKTLSGPPPDVEEIGGAVT